MNPVHVAEYSEAFLSRQRQDWDHAVLGQGI